MIANAALLGVLPDGEERHISIEIGQPYAASADEWRCPVAVHGLHDRLADIAGVDSLQSLTLALRLVHKLLSHFEAAGGQLLDPKTRMAFSQQSYFAQE